MNNDNEYIMKDNNNEIKKTLQHTIKTFNYLSLMVQIMQFYICKECHSIF